MSEGRNVSSWAMRLVVGALITGAVALTASVAQDAKEGVIKNSEQDARLTSLEQNYNALADADKRIEDKLDKLLIINYQRRP